MSEKMNKAHIAILATNGFEESELFEPRHALVEAGMEVCIVSPEEEKIQGFRHDKRGKSVKVDLLLQDAKVRDFDAIVLPGGVFNPDQLRMNPKAISFVQGFARAGKPIAAICHAPWILLNAGLVKGKRMTGYKSIIEDLRNAGAQVVNREVVVDMGFITSRNPDDLPAFCKKIIDEIGEGYHRRAA